MNHRASMRKLLLSLGLALFTARAFGQGSSPIIKFNTIQDLESYTIPPISVSLIAYVTGYSTTGDGLGGKFYYDGASVLATNIYSVFAPVAGVGRWLKIPTAIANQNTAAVKADLTTYAWNFLRGNQTNEFAIGSDNTAVYLQTWASKPLYINSSAGANNTILNATGGNVGIGTTSPISTEDVRKDSVGLSDNLYVSNNSTNANSGSSINFADAISQKRSGVIGGAWTTTGTTDGYITLRTRGADALVERMRIDNVGNVGVGTAIAPDPFDVWATGTSLGGTGNLVGRFNNVAGSNGIGFGYDSSGTIGLIIPTSTLSTIALWTHNGTAFGERGRVTILGGLHMGGTSDPGAGVVAADGGAIVGATGTKVLASYSAAASLTFGLIAANTTADQTIAVTGAGTNSVVMVGTDGAGVAFPSGLVLSGFVTATNVVTVRCANVTVGGITPAVRSVRATVFQY